MITANTLSVGLDRLLGSAPDWQIIAEAVLQLIARDTDELVILPIAPPGSPADHFTVARITPCGGVTPAFLADPASHDFIRNRFRRTKP